MKRETWVTAEVYDSAYKKLRGMRSMRDGAAREALHDAVVLALQKPPPEGGVRHPTKYLVQLACWRRMSAARSAAARHRMSDAYAQLPREDSAPSPERAVAASRALLQLRPQQLRSLAGALARGPHRDVSERVRVSRALRALEAARG